MNKVSKTISKSLCIIISIFVIAMSVIISKLWFDDSLQIKAIGLLITSLILWISEAVPMSIATLVLVFAMPFLGLMDYDTILSNFGLGTSLFIMASSGITVAIANSNIPNKITATVFKKTGNHPYLLVFFLGIAITIFSGFVSSLATCTLFSSLVATSLKNAKIDPKSNNMGKVLMLVIPACSGIGGFISPAGTPANLLVMEILKANSIEVSFGQWCLIGAPISIITAIIFLVSVIVIFKPKEILILNTHLDEKFNRKDFLLVIILSVVVICWFLTSSIPVLTTTGIAILGLGILFIPKLNILDMNKFSNGVNWDLVFTMGSVSVLMLGITQTGLITSFVNAVFSNVLHVHPLCLLMIVSLAICIIRAFVPTTTAVIALLAPVLVEIASKTSLNFLPLMFIAAYWAATALLFVHTEPIYLITYKEHYYNQVDLLRSGCIPSILGGTVVTCLIYYISISIIC